MNNFASSTGSRATRNWPTESKASTSKRHALDEISSALPSGLHRVRSSGDDRLYESRYSLDVTRQRVMDALRKHGIEAAFVQSGPPGAFAPGGPAALRTTDFNSIAVNVHPGPVNESFVYLRTTSDGRTQVEVFVHIED